MSNTLNRRMICWVLLQSSFPCLVGLDLSKFQQLLHIALSLLPMPSELVLVPSLSRLGGGRPLGHTHPPAIIFLFRRRRRPTRKHELDERRPAGGGMLKANKGHGPHGAKLLATISELQKGEKENEVIVSRA